MQKQITLGSLFDGIGGFPYAASFYGIEALWASEILPEAISVTRRHFPSMRHVGDITALHGGELPPVDIVTFGSPCQGLSTAGLRRGLADERSGLFSEAIRIIRQMQEATNGKNPQIAIWENVPGALLSNSRSDFRAVLEAFTAAQIPIPPSGRWTNAGMVRSESVDLAWCMYDAQYFGTAQRRRRVFLAADFGGKRAGKILFVPKSLRGYSAAVGTPQESASAGHKGGPGSADSALTSAVPSCFAMGINGNLAGPLTASYAKGSGSRAGKELDVVFCAATGQSNAEILIDLAPTLHCGCEQPYITHNQAPGTCSRYTVRRLTPTECERLQGYPDGWTAYGRDGKPISDAKRYRMLGNSVAVPCVAYLMQGIRDCV